MNNSMKIAIIGNSNKVKSNTSVFEEQILRKIFAQMYSLNVKDINTDTFVKLIKEYNGINTSETMTSFDILYSYNNIPENVQLEIVLRCTEPKPNLPTLLNIHESGKTNLFKNVDIIDNEVWLTETELRKRLKYSKNPMEKMQLQKELNSIKYANGKHRKGH